MESWKNFITDVAPKEGMIHFVWDVLYAVLKNLQEFQEMIFTRVRLVSDFSIVFLNFSMVSSPVPNPAPQYTPLTPMVNENNREHLWFLIT